MPAGEKSGEGCDILKGYFFNAVPTTDLVTYPSGYDRGYDADDHAAFFAPFFSEAGVFGGRDADACLVQVQSGYTLAVKAGAVCIRGRMAVLDGTETVEVSQDCKVVVRMDKSMAVRDFRLLAVTELVRTEDVYDLELASVTLAAVAGGHEVRLTDTRTFLSYMGQPAYYPPDSDSLPYVLWLYTLGFPLSDDQRTMVEANPSLMSIFHGSIGAGRAGTVAFTAAEWANGALTIPRTKHGRQSAGFGYTLRHRRADGSLCANTWAVLGTDVSYDAASGDIVLRCADAYDGEIAFQG